MTCANVVPDFGYDVTHASVGLWTNSPVFHLSIAPVDTATPTGMPETFLKLYPPGQKGSVASDRCLRSIILRRIFGTYARSPIKTPRKATQLPPMHIARPILKSIQQQQCTKKLGKMT
eukprot:CAMPEP_0206588212 /NCGR_PEP_ID=MMETSP0325_2-20121206/38131_1 /ASSEMBLY_ACC=CAM_ASM_000347 /TAXON_ID=2866 /ORGANISM="Crypthecodinium cohnii, Strain Seligo" /LENGTH=117 /DNA_ID=CAMNT_0054096413 /DNA_START=785 /DNA_END=1134 /DNA_ORIENTATION=-